MTAPQSFFVHVRHHGKFASTATANYVGDTVRISGVGNDSGRVRYLGIVELQ